MQKQITDCDILIFGGGVAGLWLLNRLTQLGYHALLLETEQLGGGQSIVSQGIIHGGTKYGLSGVTTSAANSISDMPQRWRRCLRGDGELDLSDVEILSPNHYLWSKQSTRSKLSTFLASSMMSSKAAKLSPDQMPTAFSDPAFRGSIYALDEIVLNVSSLLGVLAKAVPSQIKQIDWAKTEITLDSSGSVNGVRIGGETITAQHYIFAAGAGNEQILQSIGINQPQMQRRPLQMTVVKQARLPAIFAHCIGDNPNPRVTITTHRCDDGTDVWYLGGELAETGARHSKDEHIQFAKKEMRELLPWINLDNAQWSSFFIDRAEPKMPGGKRPDNVFAEPLNNFTVAWPTKLALVPVLADKIIDQLPAPRRPSNSMDTLRALDLPVPTIACPAWETPFK